MKPTGVAISIVALGYAAAITLLIFGCVEDKKYWLIFLLVPYLFIPAMTILLNADEESNPFIVQFGYFMVSLLFVSSWAMLFVFISNNEITYKGLLFGLSSNIALYGSIGITGYIIGKDNDMFDSLV